MTSNKGRPEKVLYMYIVRYIGDNTSQRSDGRFNSVANVLFSAIVKQYRYALYSLLRSYV